MQYSNDLDLPPIYPILDTASLARHNVEPLIAAECWLATGARILQFRHKTAVDSFWPADTFALAQRLAQLCRDANVLFIVNDRADYAALLHSGLHIGQDDLSPADARRVIGPNAVLGFSTHNLQQLRDAAAEPVDYVAFGPVFSTNSKDRADPTVGPDLLRQGRALTEKPLVAIGGITRDNAQVCWDAGANSVAVIAGLLPAHCSAQSIRDRMTEWQQLRRA